MPASEDKRGPGLRFPPPALPAALVGGGWWLDRQLPMPIAEPGSTWWPGIAVVALALLLALVALVQFLRAKTHVEPWQPTSTVIQHGVFRYSRNPIYLAFCIATLGCALWLNSWWIVIGLAPLAFLLQVLVIRREERYLEAKFGESYLDYKQRVRRWF